MLVKKKGADVAQILVVDDDPVTCLLLQTILQRSDHAVTVVNDAKDALLRLDDSHFDLVITDLMMPDINGLALINRIREQKRHRNLPVIVLTAVGQMHWQQKAVESGANVVLSKPFSSRELTNLISRQLNDARLLS